MAVHPHPDTLLGRLATLPDPRVRKGRRFGVGEVSRPPLQRRTSWPSA